VSRVNARVSVVGERLRRTYIGEKVYPYLSILPALLAIALFTIYPILYAARISVYRYILTRPKDRPFVGLQNFREVITSYYFHNSLRITAIYTVSVLVVLLVFGLLVALLLNSKVRMAYVLRTFILWPWAIPAAVSGLLWKWLLNSDFGALNGLLYTFGLITQYIPFLANPTLAKISLVMAHVWKEIPLVAIFFLAGLQLIPNELYEAAKIDGGGAWSTLRHITLPLLRPTILVVTVYETMVAILTFDEIYVLTGGGPGDATALISWFAYAEIFKSLNLGHGIALSLIIAAITLVLVLLYLRVLKPEEIYS